MKAPVKPAAPEPRFSALRDADAATWQTLGCTHTWQEILQQPATWRTTTAELARADVAELVAALHVASPKQIVLTGSGSSLYVGECAAPALQAGLGMPCRALAAGTLLADPDGVLPAGGGLLISIARSGDSPESVAVVDARLVEGTAWTHLAVTCNRDGQLATRYRGDARMHVLLLDPATDDRSLVMTSSFTNLVLGVSALLPRGGMANAAAVVAEALFDRYGDALSTWGARRHDAVVYLGSGASWGAAREAALKMLEMSAGAVRVMPETSLGLRHGPMAWFNRDSLLVSFLSGDANMRAYETDLLAELTHKHLAAARIVVGEGIDPALVGDAGLAVELPGLYALPAMQQAMVHVIVGQLLAFFQCLAQGQRPDAPSQGVLTRVVKAFPMHASTRP